MAFVFGPVHSRRFGISLGVDLSPAVKQCNFDCVYCELCAAKPVGEMREVASASDVVADIERALQSGIACDVLTFTANGEPTLYPHLAELVMQVRALLARFPAPPKLLILSNGSRFGIKNVREALQGFDIVKFSLDAASERVFKRVDRAARGIEIGDIIEGIATFAREFAGELIAEVLLVKGYNDSPDDVAQIADALRNIAPARVDVGTIDRPSAYKVSALSAGEIEALLPLFWGLRVFVPRREALCCPQSYDSAQILATLRRRPLSADDIAALFDKPSQQRLQTLVQNGEVIGEEAGGIMFYCAR
ncbi:MAG: radical SAM protein [Helicobacter sp.]|nr:radical SAM protein [Helicobacter sp.]